MMNKIKEIERINKYEKVAKAIYIVSDLEQMNIYLDGLVMMDYITYEQMDEIIDKVTDGLVNVTVGDFEKIRKMVVEL